MAPLTAGRAVKQQDTSTHVIAIELHVMCGVKQASAFSQTRKTLTIVDGPEALQLVHCNCLLQLGAEMSGSSLQLLQARRIWGLGLLMGVQLEEISGQSSKVQCFTLQNVTGTKWVAARNRNFKQLDQSKLVLRHCILF